MNRTFIVLLLALVGCESQSIEGYPPLNEIIQRPKLPLAHSDNVYTTVGTNVYTTDLDRFNDRYPEGSVEYQALMTHEQVHARRQFDYQDLPGEMALWSWIYRYTTDPGFMWREEQRALYAEIQFLRSKKLWTREDTMQKAQGLSRSYRTVKGESMISEGAAKEWIELVLQGEWKPGE